MSAKRANLDRLLGQVRSRWLLRDVLFSVSWLLLVIGPMCLVLGWLDYSFDFTRATRAVELVLLIAAVVWVVRRWVLGAVKQNRDDVNTALQVEAVDDRFGGRLVSRIEFAQGLVSKGTSTSLIAHASELVDAQADDISAENVIDLRPTHKPAAGGALVVIVLLLTVVAQPTLAGIWIQRTMIPWAGPAWPRRTHIEDVESSHVVRRGDSLTITGRCTGTLPSDMSGELRWETGGGRLSFGRSHAKVFDVADDGTFNVTIGPLLESLDVTIHAGDNETADIPINVVIPPELASIEALYQYPEFTARKPDNVQSGDVRAIISTQVTLTVNADRPVKRGEVTFKIGDKQYAKPVRLNSDTQGTIAFDVTQRGRYTVQFYDEYDFTTDNPATFVIDPIDNELPTIQVTQPGMEHRVTPMTRLRIAFEAADDFGVSGAAIRWSKVDTSTADQTVEPASVRIELPKPRQQWSGTFVWDLASCDLEPGDQINYSIEVYDEGPHLTDAKVGISQTRRLEVLDPDALSRSLEAQIRDALGELNYLVRQQATGRDETTAAMVDLPAGDDPVVPAQMQRLQVEINRQVRIARQMGRLAKRLETVANELSDSFLAESTRIEELKDLAEKLDALASGPMPGAADSLKRARQLLGDGEDNQ